MTTRTIYFRNESEVAEVLEYIQSIRYLHDFANKPLVLPGKIEAVLEGADYPDKNLSQRDRRILYDENFKYLLGIYQQIQDKAEKKRFKKVLMVALRKSGLI